MTTVLHSGLVRRSLRREASLAEEQSSDVCRLAEGKDMLKAAVMEDSSEDDEDRDDRQLEGKHTSRENDYEAVRRDAGRKRGETKEKEDRSEEESGKYVAVELASPRCKRLRRASYVSFGTVAAPSIVAGLHDVTGVGGGQEQASHNVPSNAARLGCGKEDFGLVEALDEGHLQMNKEIGVVMSKLKEENRTEAEGVEMKELSKRSDEQKLDNGNNRTLVELSLTLGLTDRMGADPEPFKNSGLNAEMEDDRHQSGRLSTLKPDHIWSPSK
ncbi:unnamed protein product [Protopolystoma xenopodis]|uniref:Uncharacterized protein n=1 Tax=Protopolystoma xenopodis TaxID=117903 RepID=A0A448X975_9PLAT|nr:unnamed protein product [Protopolystoma xenopodis]